MQRPVITRQFWRLKDLNEQLPQIQILTFILPGQEVGNNFPVEIKTFISHSQSKDFSVTQAKVSGSRIIFQLVGGCFLLGLFDPEGKSVFSFTVNGQACSLRNIIGLKILSQS